MKLGEGSEARWGVCCTYQPSHTHVQVPSPEGGTIDSCIHEAKQTPSLDCLRAVTLCVSTTRQTDAPPGYIGRAAPAKARAVQAIAQLVQLKL